MPGDGVANPWEICLALGTEAMDRGVQVVEKCRVLKVEQLGQAWLLFLCQVEQKGGKVTEVQTSMGNVACEYFVNSAGFWSRYYLVLPGDSSLLATLDWWEKCPLLRWPCPSTPASTTTCTPR